MSAKKNKKKKSWLRILIVAALLMIGTLFGDKLRQRFQKEEPENETQEETEHIEATKPAENGKKRFFYNGNGYTKKVGTGFTGASDITGSDLHAGWDIGYFMVDGFTSSTKDDKGNMVFLKTVGDEISLQFFLQQAINRLNGDSSLSINLDEDGFDAEYNVQKSNAGFGRGTLIVRYTDHENYTKEPVVYRDYLFGKQVGAETKVELYGEGDYEIALDYEVVKADSVAFLFPSYTNYKFSFRFSVRNGNCMVYPFDSATGRELNDRAYTENGFYLDLAKSRYLDIVIRRSTLATGAAGLTEDTRFNGVVRDKQVFSDEGIYEITVKNKYTGEETKKSLYVGKDKLLKAYVMSGYSLAQIQKMLDQGATILDDGTIVSTGEKTEADGKDKGMGTGKIILIVIGVIVALVLIALGIRYYLLYIY